MNEKIKKHLINYFKTCSWYNDKTKSSEYMRKVLAEKYMDLTNETFLMNILVNMTPIYSKIGDSHRWYDELFVVVEVNGMLIGFDSYHVLGDKDLNDMGLEHNPCNVYEVERKTKQVVYYIPI